MAVPPHSSVSGLCWLHYGSRNLYQQVPLQNVHVDATLYDLCAEVKLHQTYVHNNLHTQSGALSSSHASNSPLECVYIFPLDEESAVFSFVADLDGVVVQGRIRDKMEARAEYNSALVMDRSAMLLEQSSDNIFRIKVGNLKPGSVCTITLTYLTLLEQEGRHNRLTLPMIIAPKYTPSIAGPMPPSGYQLEPAPNNTVHKGYHCHQCLCSPIIGTRHYCDTCAYDLCHGCHMQHDVSHHIHSMARPLRNSTAIPTIGQSCKLRDLTIKLTITMPSPIVSIQCPSHPSETQITHIKHHRASHATALFHSTESCSLSKDFILLVEQQRCFDPRVLCELDTANNTAAVSLAFIPPPLDMLSASQIQCELVFLIDCSGSMHGSSITCVRECMQLLLRSLPMHSRFNIVTFGSTWFSLFPSSQTYDDTTLSIASQFVSTLGANLGGTEIYPPLLHVLSSDVFPTHPRQVFLLTDGQVSNVEQLVRLTSQHAVSTRLFTFGIGGAVDRLLCKKLAQAGRGKCEFVTAEDGAGGAGMRDKVVRQVARAMQPVLTDVKVDWRQLTAPSMRAPSASFLQCPSIAPAIFMSSRYILHAMNASLPDSVWQQAKAGQNVEFECEITITARSNHAHEKDLMHHSVVLTGDQISQACVIHTLAARERIRELENLAGTTSGEAKKGLEDEILQLGLKHTLSSSRTSFVGVWNAGTDSERLEETSTFHKAEGDDGFFSGGSALRRARICTLSQHLISSSFASENGVARDSFVAEPFCFSSLQAGRSGESCSKQWAPQRIAKAAALENCCDQEQGFAMHRHSTSYSRPTSLASGFSSASTKPAFKTGLRAAPCHVIRSSGGFKSMRQAPQKDAFENLIHLQSATGMWQITPMLVDTVHVVIPASFSTLTMQSLQAISKEHGVGEAVVGALVALRLLETYYKHRRAEWEMLATKALFFLNEDAKVSAKLQEEIQESVAKLLGN